MLMFTVRGSGGRRFPVPFPALLLMLVLFAGAAAGCAGVEGEPDEQAAAATEAEEQVAEEHAADRGFFERLFEPEPELVTVPPGTVVTVRLLDSASSHASAPGETVRAAVVHDVIAEDAVVIPAGATAIGRVEDAHVPKIGGRARLRVDFFSLELPSGESVPVSGSVSAVGKSEAGKDAAAIAGGAAAGAILGHQVDDDDEGKVIGGVVGGGIGSAIAQRTKGRAVVFPAGTVVDLRLDAPVTVEIEA